MSRRAARTRYTVRDRRAFAALVRALAREYGGPLALVKASKGFRWPLSRARLYEWMNGERREVSAESRAKLLVVSERVPSATVAKRLTSRLVRLLRAPRVERGILGASGVVVIGPAIDPHLEAFIYQAADQGKPLAGALETRFERAMKRAKNHETAGWPEAWPPVLMNPERAELIVRRGWPGAWGTLPDGQCFLVTVHRAAERYLRRNSED